MITYLQGDVTKPVDIEGMRNIVHVCNDYGGWGAGVVLAISKRWRTPEAVYRAHKFPSHHFNYELGSITPVRVEDNIRVVNMIAQHGNSAPGEPACDLEALDKCMYRLLWLDGSFHMPRIGCGLGGRDWETEIRPIIEGWLGGRDVFVYDYPMVKPT
jgi:O-acetyl-ADP-ribose deacetylase (regulator of RNase III)